MKKAGIGSACVGLMLGGMLILMACSTAWIGEAEKIVAALIPATANILALVGTLRGNIPTEELQTVQNAGAQAGADLQSMQSLIVQYEKADAAAQPGLLSQIQAALSAVQVSLNGILPAMHIKDAATEAKVTGVVGILLEEVQAMADIVPLENAGAPSMMSVAAREVKKKTRRSANEFAGAYNAAMTAKTGNEELDRATAGLRIHAHGKIARWASAGFLK
jgi:hypothetical protein